jgi:hypothetical protein
MGLFDSEEIGETFEAMNHILSAGLATVIGTAKVLSENQEFPKYVARVSRNLYRAYLDEGFTPADALQLTIAYIKATTGTK